MSLLDELEKNAKAATPGPWFDSRTTKSIQITSKSPVFFERKAFNIVTYPTRTDLSQITHQEWVANATHIALCSPDNILKLVQACRVMREALDSIEHLSGMTLMGDPADYDFDPEDCYSAGAHNAFCDAAESARTALTEVNAMLGEK